MAEVRSTVWIALVEVEELPRSLGTLGDRAYVNALVPTRNEKDVPREVSSALEAIGWRLCSVEGMEDFDLRHSRIALRQALIDLARTAQETGECQFDSFYCYGADEVP